MPSEPSAVDTDGDGYLDRIYAATTAGTVYRIAIEPYATSNLFKAGHRIRLDVSSSNFPRYDLNYNTGEAEGEALRLRRGVRR